MEYQNESRRSAPLPRESAATFLKRISWGAVFAGFLLALVVNLTLNLLGIGIGLGSINPAEQGGADGLGIGSIIWYIVSTIISLLAGGYVAAHLAGVPNRNDSILHGLLSWCLFTIFSFYLLTTAVGKIVSVTGSVVGQAFSLVGQGASAVAPELANTAQEELQGSDFDVQRIVSEAQTLLRQTGKQDLQPENMEDEAQQAGQQVENAAENPDELGEVVQRIFAKGDSVISDVDKEAMANVLAARTDQSPAEARQTVDAWSQQYQEAKQKIAQLKEQATEQAEQAAEQAASAVSKAAIAGFFALIIGAIASGAGGLLGKPKDVVREEEYA